MLTYFLILSAGVAAGFVLCGLLASNRDSLAESADAGRLNFLDGADVTTTVVHGYHAIFPVGIDEPLAMGADFREVIDAARKKRVDYLSNEWAKTRMAAEEKVR